MAAKPQTVPQRPALPAGPLPWHRESWAQFSASLSSGRLAHAVLLGAPRGTGKRHFAEDAAALLLCAEPQELGTADARACGQCKQCWLLAAESHPDLAILAPEDSRVIKIEQVRRLGALCMRSPQVARRKVAIIDSADRLHLNAANALLKTLEEPVDDVVLLLLHHAGEPLLPTIRSRCQALRLALPTPEIALPWLRGAMPDSSGQMTDEILTAAIERARGAPLAAWSMLQNGQLAAGDDCLESLRLFLRGDRQLVEAVAPFVKLGLEPSLDLVGHWAFEAMKMSLGNDALGSGKYHDMLVFLAKNNPAHNFAGILDQVTEARRGQVYNLSPELTLNDILLSWKDLMPRRRRASPAGIR